MKIWIAVIALILCLLAAPPIHAEPLGEFQSVEALKAWLKEDNSDSHIFIICPPSGVVQLNSLCYWSARTLKQNARKDGYEMDIQYTWYDSENVYHARVTTVIQGKIYLIEPSTDEVSLLAKIW